MQKRKKNKYYEFIHIKLANIYYRLALVTREYVYKSVWFVECDAEWNFSRHELEKKR